MSTTRKSTAEADANLDVRHAEALLKTGALQSAIFNSANFSSIATDAKGVIQIFNVGAERMLGYAAGEVVNKITPADISDPQEVIVRAEALSVELGTPIAPGFEALVFKASRGIEDIYELTYFRKDGSRFPAVVSVTALRDAEDAIIGYLLIGTDNTARKQAEEALLKAGALQSAIFNSANFSSIATDAKGVIQIFNVGAERMLGYAAAEVMNKITPADISDPQEVIARAEALSVELGTTITPGFEALVFKASRGIEDIYELTYFRKDGSRFPAVVSVTALRDAQNAIIGYLLIGTDNTARKQAEEALLKAGALQSAIFNSANFSSIATDAKGVIQIFNVGAERMLGYAAAEVVNKITPADISDPQEVIVRAEALSVELGTTITPGFEALVFKASRGIEDIYELTYFRKDGSRFPAVVSVTALRDAQDAIIGYLLIGTDNTARKQAEEALLKAGALQSAIFNSANFSSIATDAKGVIQIFNVGAERMLGYAAAEVVDRITPADISDPDEVIARATALSVELGTTITPGFEALVFKASRGIEDIYELTYFRKDGSRFPAVVSVTALRDAQDAIIGYLLIGTDNTARKQAEEALLKAGALQRAIFNSANFSSIATDAKGVIQIFNVGAERMLGYAAADVMNKITPADISDPEEVIARATVLSLEFSTPIAPGFEALVFKASRGIEDIYELTYFRKDGSRFPAVVSVTALRDAQDAIIGYLLIGTDNTARKQVEEERKKLDQRLRDQHFYTRSLIESNIDAIMTTDPRGIVTDVNKQTEALTGCTRDELIGAPFKNYFTDPARAEAGINRVLNEGKVTNYELTARARDGKLTVVSYNATTFHDRDRSLQGVFAAARDVTELKRFEQTLQQKNVELEGASRMKSEFLANMSHELRTPLNAIIGFSEVLRDGLMGEMTDQQRGFIGDIFGSGKHLLSLINDILDLSKVEAGKMTLDLEPVDVSSLFVNSLSIIREKAAARRIRLSVEGDAALGSIQADPRKLKQILYNLLSNAVKFSADGGQVTVSAQHVRRADVGRLSTSWTGRNFQLDHSDFAEFLQISVTDGGIGISPQGLEQLFKPFSQIDSGLARKFEGTGLGLAMVKLLAELHGGAVAVESAVDKGSCFTVWLPLRAAEGAAHPGKAGAALRLEAAAGVRTALVVEDDYKSAELIRVQLEAEGFKVLHAASAEAALVLAVQQPLSLITLDIMLPNMDGWDFLARIKQVQELRRIPVVIISIVADPNKGFSLGAAAVMQKPISRQELYEALVDLGLFPLPQGQALKVLVVDDDPKAVELIAVRILGFANTVLRAYGGREAIDAARRELPDLIVLDLMMPEVSGFDVVEALRGHPDTARIPILVITAKQITDAEREMLNGYVTAIMEKSTFDPDRLTAEVRRAMSGRTIS
jgi:PAS domain S-box-containing protein